MKIKYVLDDGAFPPIKAHDADAGYDIRTPQNVRVAAHHSAVIDTGLHMAIPEGYYGRIASKSGLNVNDGIVTEGVIDSGYTGSIKVKLYNHGEMHKSFYIGDKITQIIIEPCVNAEMVQTETLEETERGSNGFGSSGR